MNMLTLTETSLEEAFESPQAAEKSIDYAYRFTETFAASENLPVALREARLLAVQFPAILRDPQHGDLFAGRISYGVVGFSPEPVGLGYYCRSDILRDWLKKGKGSGELRQKANRLIEFWEGQTTAGKARTAFKQSTSSVLPSDNWMGESGIAFPLYRMAGMVLDYEKLLRLGLDGLDKEAGYLDDFGDSCRAAVGVLRSSIDYYSNVCSDRGIRASLQAIRHDPPATFHQAIQLFWLYAVHSGTWNWGRLDDTLGPFLVADLESGLIDEAEALDMLCSLWRLMHAYNNMYNNRVIIGGKGRKNSEAADRFALLAIEATRQCKLNQPQLSLRFHHDQNPELWEAAITAIGEGCTFPMLYNDDVNIPAVAKAFNVSPEMAISYMPYGCGEYVLARYSAGTPNAIINLLKALETAVRGGVDPDTGRKYGDCPATGELDSFEKVWKAYTGIVQTHIAAAAEAQKTIYEVTGNEAPFLFISMLTDDCMEQREGAFSGGVRYLGGSLETYGNNDTANSLHAINELVFKQRKMTLQELVEAMDCNFKGHEDTQALCKAVSKYGNDEGTSDLMAEMVHDHVCNVTRDQAERVGLHNYLVVIINNWANTTLGKLTGASADGRSAGQPLANGNNPSSGTDTNGITAFLNSLTRLDPCIHAGAVQNMKFSRSWFGSMRPKLDSLLKTYFAKGGTQAMITVVSRDDLEAAIREPENWGHLMVRVGGFSIRFVDLDKNAQQEVLSRTLH